MLVWIQTIMLCGLQLEPIFSVYLFIVTENFVQWTTPYQFLIVHVPLNVQMYRLSMNYFDT